MNRCVISAGVGGGYPPMLDRFKQTLERVGNKYPVLAWRDVWPPNSMPHEENYYGFKCYAFEEAKRQGFDSILWLDSQVIVMRPLDAIFDFIELAEQGFYVCGGRKAFSGQDRLNEFTPAGVWPAMNATPEETAHLSLMCGCAIGLDFASPQAVKWYDQWFEACKRRVFYTAGRRGDEVVGSIIANRLGLNERFEASVAARFLQGTGPTYILRTLPPWEFNLDKAYGEMEMKT